MHIRSTGTYRICDLVQKGALSSLGSSKQRIANAINVLSDSMGYLVYLFSLLAINTFPRTPYSLRGWWRLVFGDSGDRGSDCWPLSLFV